MPDNVTPNPLAGTPASGETAAKNAEIAAKLAAQDITGQSMASSPEDLKTAGDALDALAAQVKPEETTPPEPTPEEKAAAEAKAAADAKAAEEAKAAADAKAAEEAAAKTKSDDFFKDSPSLPSGASPKSAEAFAAIKLRATQEITAREAKLAELQSKLEELEKKASTPPPELTAKEQELAELKQWRAKLDVEFDPKFKEFDRKVAETNEFIYAQLKEHPVVTQAVIDEIKKYGGPAKCDLTKVFEAIKDDSTKQIVQAKIAEVRMIQYQKAQAITEAKTNFEQYTKARQEEWQKVATSHAETTQQVLNQFLPKLEWFADRKPSEKADETEKKSVAEHNEFVKTVRAQIAEAVKDDSPEMRATLITGLAQFFNFQRMNKALTEELAQTKKALADVSAKWESVKAASINRSRNSNAAGSTASAPKAPAQPPIGAPAGDALDKLMADVMQKRAAAGANA